MSSLFLKMENTEVCPCFQDKSNSQCAVSHLESYNTDVSITNSTYIRIIMLFHFIACFFYFIDYEHILNH